MLKRALRDSDTKLLEQYPPQQAWVADYVDQDGDRHIKTFKRKKEAEEYSDQVGVDVRAGVHTPPSKSITVAQAAENWIKSVALEGREALTTAQYRQHAPPHYRPYRQQKTRQPHHPRAL